jgi:ParB family chromosome partitioning protein
VQREDLNPLEEATTYQELKDEFNLGLKEIAKRAGKQLSTISNKVRLLQLPSSVKEGLWAGKISEGHARALLGLEREELIEVAYGQVLKDKLSVRATEELVANNLAGTKKKSTHKKSLFEEGRRSLYEHYEKRMMDKLGTRVHITSKKGAGNIRLAFYSDEELERLVKLVDQIKE